MIWIYEQLTDEETRVVSKKEPFLGFSYEPKYGIYIQTERHTRETKGGKVVELRKAKLFGFKEIGQGFICDDIDQAHLLSKLIKKLPFSGKDVQQLNNLDRILEYLHTADSVLVEWISIPIETYCKYYSKKNPKHLLDVMDVDSLGEWKINLSDYMKSS